jgi:hypothetical protein
MQGDEKLLFTSSGWLVKVAPHWRTSFPPEREFEAFLENCFPVPLYFVLGSAFISSTISLHWRN